MVYKPLAVRVALIAGFRRALRVFNFIIAVVEDVGMCEIPKGFPGDVGREEGRLYGFPCFPHLGISTALLFQFAVFNFVKPALRFVLLGQHGPITSPSMCIFNAI